MEDFEDTVMLSPHRYVYAPERKPSMLRWVTLTCAMLAMSASGVMLVRAVVVWLSNGQLM